MRSSNVRSLAMVEAAIESAATGTRVSIPDVIDRALAHAIDVEANPGHRERAPAVAEGWASRASPDDDGSGTARMAAWNVPMSAPTSRG